MSTKKRKPKPKKEPEPEPVVEQASEPEPVSIRKVQIPTAYRESIKTLSTLACSMRDLVEDIEGGLHVRGTDRSCGESLSQGRVFGFQYVAAEAGAGRGGVHLLTASHRVRHS